MLNPIRPDGPESVASRVFRELRTAIVEMAFKPGQALSEKEVADSFGVSRQPVREAFIKLSEAGLLSIRPQRGTYVVKISARQVYDVRFVREAVEVAVVRKAALELSGGAIRSLRETVGAQRKVASDERPDRFFPLDEAFHRGMALGVGCQYAWHVVEDMKAQMDRVRYLSLPEATPLSRLIDQHEAIVDAIAAHDPAGAETAMRTHLSEILTSLPALAERFPDLFEPELSDLAKAGTAA